MWRRSAGGIVVMMVVMLMCVVGGWAARAQGVPRSQLGSVSQQVADVRISLKYRRPVARGRALFGALVPWGAVWTPSADSAAVLSVSRPITVNGSALPAGTYGVWAIPDSASWTFIFSATPAAFHLRYPEGRDVLRVRARPVRGEYVETLEFAFPMVDADSARLELRWGNTVVPLRLRAGTPDAR